MSTQNNDSGNAHSTPVVGLANLQDSQHYHLIQPLILMTSNDIHKASEVTITMIQHVYIDHDAITRSVVLSNRLADLMT